MTEPELLESAWGVIANADRRIGTTRRTSQAAERWRDQYHEWLGGAPSTPVDKSVTDAVREIHEQRTMIDGYGMDARHCVECRQTWPCATIAAVERVMGPDVEIVADNGEELF